jgi:hypothetical protein
VAHQRAAKGRDGGSVLTDKRLLEFDAEALVAAVAASPRAAERLGLLRQVPFGACFHPDTQEVEFLYGHAQAPRRFRLKAGAVGAFLVSYCIRARVPMPRGAEKSVQVEPNGVVLSLRTQVPRFIAVATEF